MCVCVYSMHTFIHSLGFTIIFLLYSVIIRLSFNLRLFLLVSFLEKSLSLS